MLAPIYNFSCYRGQMKFIIAITIIIARSKVVRVDYLVLLLKFENDMKPLLYGELFLVVLVFLQASGATTVNAPANKANGIESTIEYL